MQGDTLRSASTQPHFHQPRCLHLIRRRGPEGTGIYVGLCDALLDENGRCTLPDDILGHRSKPDIADPYAELRARATATATG